MQFDFVVIGAGMAGVSVAAELSRTATVLVLEQEPQPGYHATGRSAALYSEIYGNATIRALTRGSRDFYHRPPAGFSDSPLVRPRGTLYFARHDEEALLDRFAETLAADTRPVRLDAAETRRRVPAFRPGYLSGALYEEGSADIDVAAVLQGFASRCRQQGVRMVHGSPLERITRQGTGWALQTAGGEVTAAVVVNAAGAWGDRIAALAGVAPVGLTPKRRTAILVDLPGGASADDWPAAIHVGETFYFKPDAGLLLVSPADETPSEPCDAQPEELDIAIAADKFEQASGVPIRRVRSSWAGLRTFVADKTPVVGFDPVAQGFFWLVGQGGYGIQTAPALARVAATLARGEPLAADLLAHGIDPALLAPRRLGAKRAV